MSHSRNIFVWSLGNPILGKVLDEVMQRGNENISHVEHLVRCNLWVRYPNLFKFIQSLVFFLNNLDQGTTKRVYKQPQLPLKTNNILTFDTIIV